jgi:hypothetical protein
MTLEPIKCTKCWKVVPFHDSGVPFAVCPIYHGMRGSGFCPAFADGETAVQTAEKFNSLWLRAEDELDEARERVRDLAHRPLPFRDALVILTAGIGIGNAMAAIAALLLLPKGCF